MQHLNESAVNGVILVAGMVVIVSSADGASWDVLVKVAATVAVFWASHVFAGLVAHLGDEHAGDPSGGVRLFSAARYSLAHSWGMLAAALVPVSVLMLGATGVIADERAIWGSLWVAVAMLALLGYLEVAPWLRSVWQRIVGAAITAALGVLLILLKAAVH